ncbi:hypothetical protein [Paraburkholderia tagetis]|uniref:hypothetical protein n=1 Tax=Paraburkholderia tagetis TaxID=2913261 RepID=UPI0030845BB2
MLRAELAVAATLTATTFGVVDCGTVPDVLPEVLEVPEPVEGGELAPNGALAAAGALAGAVAPAAPLLPLLPPQATSATAKIPASTIERVFARLPRVKACRIGVLIAGLLP